MKYTKDGEDDRGLRGRLLAKRPLILASVLGPIAVAITMLVWAPWAGAVVQPVHGIGFSKGCDTPTNVGAAYTCTFVISNSSTTDTALDTLTISSVVDIVHATAGDSTSGNLLLVPTTLATAGGATCNQALNPVCTLPTGSSVQFTVSHYIVAANDPNPLKDDATLTWQDTCSSGAMNCPSGDQHSTTGSQSQLQTPTPTFTPTPTNTPTPTPTPTATFTPTPTNTTPPTPTNTPQAGEGCTPGFWKNHTNATKYPNAWPPTGLVPTQLVSSVFTIPGSYSASIGSATLAGALAFKGGSGLDGAAQILLRAAVSAVLNAASPDISYPLTVSQIVSQVNTALASVNRGTILALASTLDGDNNLGCPISGK